MMLICYFYMLLYTPIIEYCWIEYLNPLNGWDGIGVLYTPQLGKRLVTFMVQGLLQYWYKLCFV